MAETYCGNHCAKCSQREFLGCPGCKDGPGWKYGKECKLAMCCREKGHECCAACESSGNCRMLQGREDQPEFRRRKFESNQRQNEKISRRSTGLVKWFRALFWLNIIAAVVSFTDTEYIKEASLQIYTLGEIVSVVCYIIYSLILFRISSEEDRYRTAGIFNLISVAISVFDVAGFGAATESTDSSFIFFILASGIVSFLGEYYECNAHSAVLTGLNNKLSDNWTKLWKWFIGVKLVLIGDAILTIILFAPILGYIVLVGAGIITVILYIVKTVYLYQMAEKFKAHLV